MWVLDNGLPALPRDLRIRESVPVAAWAGRRFGAVRRISRADGERLRTELDDDIELFERADDGWEPLYGSGGGGWPTSPFFRRLVVPDRAALVQGSVVVAGSTFACRAVEIAVGSAAAFIELDDNYGTSRREVHPPMGVEVVCADDSQPATVRVLDRRGVVLLEAGFSGPAANREFDGPENPE